MKMIVKIHMAIALILVVVLAIPILLTSTVKSHNDELNEAMTGIAKASTYNNIHIFDANGMPIYDNGFSDDETVRKATFHIVGDKNQSRTYSLLTQNYKNELSISKLFGYAPENIKIDLTIDLDLQLSAYSALDQTGYNGCLIVLDYTTGEIKAMVSLPTVDVYDTSYIKQGAYINNALTAFAPGSVFKAVTVAAALELDPNTKDFTYTCSGAQDHIICYRRTKHGKVSLNDILRESCNCGIAKLTKTTLSAKTLDGFTEKFQLTGSEFAADLSVDEGSINSSDDLLWSANGQSQNMFSPLSIAMFYGAIANGGSFYPLKVQKSTDNSANIRIMSKYTADILSGAMTKLCEEAGINCKAFGKTGTAELNNEPSHAWFVCSLTDDNAPKYTILTFIEHGEYSSRAKQLTVDFINNYILK